MNFNLLLGLVTIIIIAALGYGAILMFERIATLRNRIKELEEINTDLKNRFYKYAKSNTKEYRKPVMPEDTGRRN